MVPPSHFDNYGAYIILFIKLILHGITFIDESRDTKFAPFIWQSINSEYVLMDDYNLCSLNSGLRAS